MGLCNREVVWCDQFLQSADRLIRYWLVLVWYGMVWYGMFELGWVGWVVVLLGVVQVCPEGLGIGTMDWP